MDLRYLLRNLLIALVGLALLVLVVVLVIKGIASISGHDTLAPGVDITNYNNTGSSAQLIVDGPINSDTDHRQVRITVSANQVDIDVLQGYQGTVLDSRTYSNNQAAYSTFLDALQRKNFSRGLAPTSSTEEYSGYCSAGDRYTFSFNDGSRDRFNYWTSNCGGGTFRGDANSSVDLFVDQIPQSDKGTIKDFYKLSYIPSNSGLLL